MKMGFLLKNNAEKRMGEKEATQRKRKECSKRGRKRRQKKASKIREF